jgi:hypothetical protein
MQQLEVKLAEKHIKDATRRDCRKSGLLGKSKKEYRHQRSVSVY